MRRSLVLPLLVLITLSGCGRTSEPKANADASLAHVERAGEILWGADVVGGVPYAFEDPKRPGEYIGFEVDIANAVARELGVRAHVVVRAWDALIPELQKGSFDMAMNGIDEADDHEGIVAFSDPYFVNSQQITVRRAEGDLRQVGDHGRPPAADRHLVKRAVP